MPWIDIGLGEEVVMIAKVLFNGLLLMLVLTANASAGAVSGLSEEVKSKVVESHTVAIKQLLYSADIQQCIRQRTLLSLVEILKIDQQWPTQTHTVSNIIRHQCAQLFKSLINNQRYHFSELMLTDDSGALVAAYPRPSDFWQGDEQKFIQPAVTGLQYVSEENWDASTGTYSFFIAMPVLQAQVFSGVLIAGINVTAEYLNQLSLEELLILEVAPGEDDTSSK